MIEKQISTKRIYEGRVITLRVDDIELENGKRSVREIVENAGGACLVAVTDEGNLCLVRQYRYAVSDYLLELPAGKLNAGENPLMCAQRELTEETGYIAKNVELMLKINPSPAYLTERIFVYLATGLKKGTTNFDEDEDIETIEISLDEAIKLIAEGKITDGKTIAGILYYKTQFAK